VSVASKFDKNYIGCNTFFATDDAKTPTVSKMSIADISDAEINVL